MHELAIASAVLRTALEHAGGRRVLQVDLRVGALRQVVPRSLDFCFGVVSRDTLCGEAALVQTPVAALMRCTSCATEWDPAPPPAEQEADLLVVPSFRCPACGSAGARVLAGEELLVESLEVEAEPRSGHNGETAPRATSPG